jgi:hypothetical protein
MNISAVVFDTGDSTALFTKLTIRLIFMRSLCGVTRRDRLRNIDLRTQLGEISIVEEIEQHQKKWKERVLGCHLQDIHGKHYFIDRLDGEIWVDRI